MLRASKIEKIDLLLAQPMGRTQQGLCQFLAWLLVVGEMARYRERDMGMCPEVQEGPVDVRELGAGAQAGPERQETVTGAPAGLV